MIYFSIVVAMNSDSLIGIKEYGSHSMPWPLLKHDMEFFKKITTETPGDGSVNAVIVGYNTWLTLPPSYKNNNLRKNIVVSRTSATDVAQHSEVYIETFNEAIDYAHRIGNLYNIFVIGGAAIYNQALEHPLLKKIFLTEIKNSYPKENIIEHGVYFPLGHNQFDELINSNYLKETHKPVEKYEQTKNIYYYFRTFEVLNGFHLHYKSMPKYPRLMKYDNSHFLRNINKITDEYQYLNLIKTIFEEGITKHTRNGDTISIFGHQLRYDLSRGYPLSTIKRSYPKAIFEELMWMIRGQTNSKILEDKNVNIWKKNSSKEYLEKYGLPFQEGDIGPGYGFQMRFFGAEYYNCHTDYANQGVDQLTECIKLINEDPSSRRIIISLWNPCDVPLQSLAPCHILYNFGVDLYDEPNDKGSRGKLNCHLFQRSWDVMLGWNTTTAALLTYLLANHCNLDPGILVHSISDAHLYQAHIDSGAVDKLLDRVPRRSPKLTFLRKKDSIENYEFEDLVIEDYYPAPAIIAEMIA